MVLAHGEQSNSWQYQWKPAVFYGFYSENSRIHHSGIMEMIPMTPFQGWKNIHKAKCSLRDRIHDWQIVCG